MDTSLYSVSTLEWVLAAVVAVGFLVIVLLFSAPFWDEFRRKRK